MINWGAKLKHFLPTIYDKKQIWLHFQSHDDWCGRGSWGQSTFNLYGLFQGYQGLPRLCLTNVSVFAPYISWNVVEWLCPTCNYPHKRNWQFWLKITSAFVLAYFCWSRWCEVEGTSNKWLNFYLQVINQLFIPILAQLAMTNWIFLHMNRWELYKK